MSSLRQPTSVSVMRPPKPPSWRDFVASDANNKPQSTLAVVAYSNVDNHNHNYNHHHINNNSSNNTAPNLSTRVLESKSTTHLHVVSDLPRHSITSLSTAALVGRSAAIRPGRQRPRAKIHRTRSEHGILTDELPRESSTMPPILKVAPASRVDSDNINPITSKKPNSESSEDCPVALEINRRCQSWLASIEACEPLDEVSYSSSTPIPSPIATAVTDNKHSKNYGGFESFQIPLHAFGEDVDVEVPDEMFVWPRDRRSSSPLSQEERLPPLTGKSRGAKRDNNSSGGFKVTKHSIASSGSHKDAFIPIETQVLPSGKSNHRAEFSNFHNIEAFDDSLKKNNQKNSSKLCCDVCITFNCYRRKDVQSDT